MSFLMGGCKDHLLLPACGLVFAQNPFTMFVRPAALERVGASSNAHAEEGHPTERHHGTLPRTKGIRHR